MNIYVSKGKSIKSVLKRSSCQFEAREILTELCFGIGYKQASLFLRNIHYADDENHIELMTFPDDSLSLNVMIDYNSEILGNQYANFTNLDDYKTEIASCKTFVFLRELEFLFKNNLIKGGSLDNAIVLDDYSIINKDLQRILFNF